MQGEGEVLRAFVLHFHNGKCHWVADGEMFRFVCENLTTFCSGNISLESSIRELLAIYSLSRSKLGFMRNYQKRNDCSAKPSVYAAKLPA